MNPNFFEYFAPDILESDILNADQTIDVDNQIFAVSGLVLFRFKKDWLSAILRRPKNLKRKFKLCGLFPASPRAANGRRPLAAPVSVASVGAALCLKIHFFF